MKAVILIGHGGIPKDFSSAKVARLLSLEGIRQRNGTDITEEEISLDREIRDWPRTPENEPFHFGTLAIADALRKQMPEIQFFVAYNEFCSPSIETATKNLINDGFNQISFISTMFTRGGIHAEFEIPEIVANLKAEYPNIELKYLWPFDSDLIAKFLALQIKSAN